MSTSCPGRTLVCMRARILNLTFGTHALKVKGQKATFLSLVACGKRGQILVWAWPASPNRVWGQLRTASVIVAEILQN